MAKRIAVYGSYKAMVPVKQRYWKHRKDCITQRYWKKTKRLKKVITDKGRYEFYGKGKDLYKAIKTTDRFVPKGFIIVSIEKFLRHPERYGYEGEWIKREVESL